MPNTFSRLSPVPVILAIVTICCFALAAIAWGKTETAITVGSISGVVLTALLANLKTLSDYRTEVNGKLTQLMDTKEAAAKEKGLLQGKDEVMAAVASTVMPHGAMAEITSKVISGGEGSKMDMPVYNPDAEVQKAIGALNMDQKRQDKAIDKLEKKNDG